MTGQQKPAPYLVLTWGNPSRGDDALGPALFDMLSEHQHNTTELDDLEVLTDFQLQIEHAVDLEQREHVLFVDAGVSCRAPYEVHSIKAERDDSFTSHAMSPSAVLAVYEQVNKCESPPAQLLTIRAYEFGLGKTMSQQAKANLQEAFEYILSRPL